MPERLYTVIGGFRWGTYCSQVTARDEVDAVYRWAEKLRIEKPIARVSGRLAKSVLQDLETLATEPLPVEGLRDVWCFVSKVGADLALCNIVLTAAKVC